ncbi:pantetheine-phosphate adenylyltransferase [Fructilactobacillus frigidiflavus]|uniref:pantetheine-phosphate adenylyltransferase n=1 Tax=Fructilactobacillus frigidiflavus TaxID=3242688 RepID=UPI0037579328
MKKVIYPGSFDPITNGHLNIIKRAAQIFDEVVVAVGNNPDKQTLFSAAERVNLIKQSVTDIQNVSVTEYNGLTVNFVKEQGTNLIIRGTRDSSDFVFEKEIANLNSLLDDQMETLLIFANKNYELISSSMVKEINRFDGDVSQFVPSPVLAALKVKVNHEKNKKLD